MSLLLAVALAPSALPSPPGDGAPVLTWTAPDGCPNAANVEQRIESYLGRMPPPGTATVEATVEPAASPAAGFRLTVAVTSPSGTSEHAVTSDRCETLADTVALVVAVALDPIEAAAAVDASRALPPQPPPPDDAPTPPPDDEPAEAPSTPPATDTPATTPPPEPAVTDDDDIRRYPRLRMALRPELVVDWGSLPAVSIGGSFSGVMLGQHWRIEASPVFMAGRSAASRRVPEATALVSLTAVDLRGCGTPRSRNRVVEGALCGGVELGALRGRGTGATQDPRDHTVLWSAGVIAPGVAFVPRYWLSVFAGVDVLVPFERPAFELGPEEVYRAQSAGLRGRIGLEIRVP